MSHLGNKMNIFMSTFGAFLIDCVESVSDKIPKSVKAFTDRSKYMWTYKEVTDFYSDVYCFITDNYNILLVCINLILLIDFIYKSLCFVSARISLVNEKIVVDRESHNNSLGREKMEQEFILTKKKLSDIEEILVDGLYNDPDYLAYKEEKWTFSMLKEKAVHMGLPVVNWGSNKSLAFAIRTTEQLKKIIDIIEPTYPDGYETQEMIDEEDE